MSSRLPHMGYILNPDLLQRSSFRGHCNTDRLGLGMSKAEIKAKHPEGTSPKHIDAMHKYMTQDGLSFQQAHNKAEASGFPALGLTKNELKNGLAPTNNMLFYGFAILIVMQFFDPYRRE